MITKVDRNKKRKKRHLRVRKKIFGTPERPRLNVFRSSKNIYAQLIDDLAGHPRSHPPWIRTEGRSNGGNVEAARKVGQLIAKRALEKASNAWCSTAEVSLPRTGEGPGQVPGRA